MIDSIGWLAVVQLVQISILFVIVFFTNRWLGSKRPHLALFLWTLFFVKCLMPPVVQSPLGLFSWFSPEATYASVWESSDRFTTTIAEPTLVEGVQPITSFSGAVALDVAQWGATPLLLIWALGSLSLAFIFATKYLKARRAIFATRTKRATGNVQGSNRTVTRSRLDSILDQLRSRLDIKPHQVRSWVSNSDFGPLVFGLYRPVIVIPAELVEQSEDLRPVVAHELCHVWRRDHFLGWLQLAAQVVFWFHPFVWMAGRQANRLCEICCDDDTIRNFELDSRTYAHGLLNVLENHQEFETPCFAPGIRPVEVTRQRIKWIVDPVRSRGFRKRHVTLAVLLSLATMPAFGSPEWGVGLLTGRRNPVEPMMSGSEAEDGKLVLTRAEHDANRKQMDFLLGRWHVTDGAGNPAGESVFAYEQSGKMLREDWVAVNEESAQGISFYDANHGLWKMTWVDSAGSIVESSGQWLDNQLTLIGQATLSTGQVVSTKTTLEKMSPLQLKTTMWVTPAKGGPARIVSECLYHRKLINVD